MVYTDLTDQNSIFILDIIFSKSKYIKKNIYNNGVQKLPHLLKRGCSDWPRAY